MAPEVGPLSSDKLTSGQTFSNSDANSGVALVDSNYASQNKLAPGSTVSIGGTTGTSTSFKVIGVVADRPAPPRATSTSRSPGRRPWRPVRAAAERVGVMRNGRLSIRQDTRARRPQVEEQLGQRE